jgi:hypothetical protein
MTSFRGLCPTCRMDRNTLVIAEHEEIVEPTLIAPTAQGNAYRILKCAGCDTIYFQRESFEIFDKCDFDLDYDGDDEPPIPADNLAELKDLFDDLKRGDPERYDCEDGISYWPKPSVGPDWLGNISDRVLIKLLKSVYTAREHDLRVLAAIGIRVVFDRVSELMEVDQTKSFAGKLDQLEKDGHISTGQRKALDVLTDAGNAAAHRGWEPSLEELKILISIMEHFVKGFALKEEAETLKQSIPPRQRRTLDNREQSAELIDFPSSKPTKNPSP